MSVIRSHSVSISANVPDALTVFAAVIIGLLIHQSEFANSLSDWKASF